MTSETQRDVTLVAGVLIGPLALLTNLLVNFVLAPWVCANHWEIALHTVQFVFLLIAAGAGWMSWREWRREGRRWPDESGARDSRNRFLAVVGIFISALSALQIFGSILAAFILGACQ